MCLWEEGVVVELQVLSDHYGVEEVQGYLPFQCVRSDKSWKQHPTCLDLDQRLE